MTANSFPDSQSITAPELVADHPLTGWLHQQGWDYHPHQLDCLAAAFKGHDVLLMAPTGAGKTLSGFLPSFIDLQNSDVGHTGLHTLYISPLKSLAVDIQRNVAKPIDDLGLPIDVETRTGDTPVAKRQRQRQKPPHMLMTTPESFALMLSYDDAPSFFKDLRFVILDEIHQLMTSKRGDLLSLNLARLARLNPNAQRIALSATVPDSDAALHYIARKGMGQKIIASNGARPEIEIMVPEERMPWSGHAATYAIDAVYNRLKDARLAVIFVNTRAQAESLFHALWEANEEGKRIAIHHGSLEKELRRKVEAKMAAGDLDCVVATSSLDLGIDWADVDLVVQIGAPKGVSRLLQRIGRSNHRMDEASSALLVPSNRFEYLECLAAVDAIGDGDLDGDPPKIGSLDVLAQHVMACACSGETQVDGLFEDIKSAWPYSDLTRDTFDQVLQCVKTGGYALKSYDQYARVVERGGVLKPSNPRVVRQYRMNIGTIVESHALKVKLGTRTLGKVEEWFINGLSPGDTFVFGGQLLRYERIDAQGIQVKKATGKTPRIPTYAGGRMPLSTALATRVRGLLQSPERWVSFPDQVRDWLGLHTERSLLPDEAGLLVETFERDAGGKPRHYLVTYPFEGRNAHQTLGFLVMKRMQRFGLKPLGFVATDYGVAIWSGAPVTEPSALFTPDLMLDDLHEWLDDTPLLKKNFRDVAVISGLIERKHPGHQKTGKQVNFNSDLIYDVLRKYEPDHILLQAARADAQSGLIDLDRLADMLIRVEGKINHQQLDRVSPLALPLILEISKESIDRASLESYALDELEAELIAEALS